MESRLLLTQRAQRSLSLAALVFGLCSAFGLPGPGRRAARASSARLFGAMSPAPPVSWPSGAAVASSESVCSVVAASAGVRRVPRRVIKAQQRKGAVRGIRLFRLFRLSRSGLQCPPELAWVVICRNKNHRRAGSTDFAFSASVRARSREGGALRSGAQSVATTSRNRYADSYGTCNRCVQSGYCTSTDIGFTRHNHDAGHWRKATVFCEASHIVCCDDF